VVFLRTNIATARFVMNERWHRGGNIYIFTTTVGIFTTAVVNREKKKLNSKEKYALH
jgi:hypothetical protein